MIGMRDFFFVWRVPVFLYKNSVAPQGDQINRGRIINSMSTLFGYVFICFWTIQMILF